MKVGVKLWSDASPDLGRPLRYPVLRDAALQLEALGFDSIWLMDHLFFRMTGQETQGVWESWTLLSALAEATRRIELGTLVLCTQFRNPALLAKMAATLDEVSGGRLILGLGAGWHQPEFDAFGIPFDHRVSRFEEALQIISPLLREGRADFTGRYYQARNCENVPRGPSPKGPPILIGGTGPRMLRLTAEYADMWNVTGRLEPESLREPRKRLRKACADAGRDPTTLVATAQIQVGYPELGPLPSWMGSYLSGSAAEIAAAMNRYEEVGISHLMIQCAPYNAAALTRLAGALTLYRH